jgi:hypothetical protein
MTALSALVPPHAADDPAKVAALVAAYRVDAEVTRPVAVDYGHALVALSGSHRIAALREVYEAETDAADLVLVLDAGDLYEAAEGDPDAIRTLDRLAAADVGDYAEAIRTLWPYLDDEARAALDDQRDP